jgi:PhnB protein
MQMRPNLNFAGFAADVLAHYQAALGGQLEILRFAGSPAADDVPADWADKVLYGRLRTPFGEVDVMDAPPGRESAIGGNVAIALDIDDDERAAQVFGKLTEGGHVLMPFAETFFARKFGMATDKFGVRWMVSVAPVALVRT